MYRQSVLIGFFLTFATLTSALSPLKRNSEKKIDFLNQILSSNKVKGDDLCSSCRSVVSTLKSVLINPTIKADISNILSDTCSKLPDGSYHELCSMVVSNYLPSMMDSLMNDIDSKSVCEDTLNLCPSTKSAVKPLQLQSVTLPPQEIKDIECAACTWLSGFVLFGLLNDATGAALGYEINQFCLNYIGDPDQLEKCQSDAEQVAELLPFIHTIVTPSLLCQNLIKINGTPICPPST